MVTTAHVAASYLISQTPRFWHRPLRLSETVAVILAGIFLDLDIFLAWALGLSQAQHHTLPTHTPIVALSLGLISILIFRRHLSPTASLLILTSLIIHLLLDDLAYWFHLLGLQSLSPYPQIFWLYPFDPRFHTYSQLHPAMSITEFLTNYFNLAPASVICEIFLIIAALVIYLHTKRHRYQ